MNYLPLQPGLRGAVLDGRVEYVERDVPDSLTGFVDRVWYLRVPVTAAGQLVYRVVADGCADLIFDFRGEQMPLVTYSACGPMLFRLPAVELIGARMLPGAIATVANQAELVRVIGASAPLAELQSASGLLRMAQSWRRPADRHDRWQALTEVLEAVLRPIGRRTSTPMATAFASEITELSGASTDDCLRSAMQLSSRQGRRLIRKQTGLTPVGLARVVRFQRALRETLDVPHRRLADVAVNNGYFDQAHFARESAVFTGMAPSALRHL